MSTVSAIPVPTPLTDWQEKLKAGNYAIRLVDLDAEGYLSVCYDEIAKALTRKGRPEWTDEDVTMLRNRLGYAGFGHVPDEILGGELEALASKVGRRSFFGLGR